MLLDNREPEPNSESTGRADVRLCCHKSSYQPGHAPHAPQGRWIREGVTVHEEEIHGPALDDATGPSFLQQLSAVDRRGRERLPRLQASLNERLDLPRQMVRAQGTAPEIRAGRDSDARPVCEADALDCPLPPTRDPLLPLVADEPRQRGRLGEG